MSWRTKVLGTIVGLVAIMGGFMLFVMSRIDPSPLRAGSTADEAWTYIHTNSPALAQGESPLVSQYSNWRADAHSIVQETRFCWRTNQLFATRTTTYIVSTNSVIVGIGSRWKFNWPF